jgi:Concanavalin A-like lectin/glucanases superfamily
MSRARARRARRVCDRHRSIAGVGTCATATIAAVANRQIAVDTVEAYAQKSVAAGETIDFRVSSPVPYQLSIVRLGWDTNSPSRDWTLATFPQAAASQRSISPGSYVHVETALAPTARFTQLTLECWVRPFRTTTPSYWQGLMSQHTNPVGGVGQCGFGLFLTDANVPCCYFGDGGTFRDEWFLSATNPLPRPTLDWHHVVAVFNAGTARLYVNGAPVPML